MQIHTINMKNIDIATNSDTKDFGTLHIHKNVRFVHYAAVFLNIIG